MADRSITVRLRLQDDYSGPISKAAKATGDFSGAADQAEKSGGIFDSIKEKISGLVGESGSLKDALGGVAAGFAGGIIGGGIADGFGSIASAMMGSVDAASDLNETVNKSQAIFGAQAGAVEKWSDSAATSFGLSKGEALDYASSLGDMFTQLGNTGAQSAKMSEKVVKLAADLGSFNNLDTGDVLERIQAGFRGEYDSLQQLVPNINAARVQTEALSETGKKSASQLTAQEKATATLNIITKDTSRAQGDFARTAHQAANQQKINAAQVKDLQAKIGQGLLPAYRAFLNLIGDVGLPALSHLVDAGGAVVQGIGPMVGLFKDLPGPVKAAAAAITAMYLANRLLGSRMGTVTGGMSRFVGGLRGVSRAQGEIVRTSSGARVEMGRFGSAIAQIGHSSSSVRQMQSAFVGAATAARRFPRSAGAAAAAMSGIRSAGKGLVGALGGPWGLALAGAGVALMAWQKHQQDAAEAARESKQRIDDLTTTLNKHTGAVTDDTRAMVAQQLQQQGVFDAVKALNGGFGMQQISYKDVTEAAMGNEAAQKRVNKSLSDWREYLTATTGPGTDYGKANEKIGKQVDKVSGTIDGQNKELKKSVEAWRQTAEATGKSADSAAAKNAELAKAMGKVATKMQAETPQAVREYKVAQKNAQTAAEDTARANHQLASDLDDANNKFFATKDASRAYQQALADAREAAKKQGGKGIGDSTQEGRDNGQKLEDAAKAAVANLSQLYKNGANNKTLSSALKTSRDDLTSLAKSFGLTGKAAKDYVDGALGKIPKDIKTKITADTKQAKANIAEAETAALGYGTTMEELPKSIQTKILTLGETKAKQIAKTLGQDYNDLAPDVKTRLIADSSNAKSAAKDLGVDYDSLSKDVQTKLKAIGAPTAKSIIKGVLDAAKDKQMTITAKARMGKVNSQLDALDGRTRDRTFSVTAVYKEIHPGDNLGRHGLDPFGAARGAIFGGNGVQRMATGAVKRQAMTTTRPVLWGEAGPEAYIPLSKDGRLPRNIGLTAAVADFYGYNLVKRAQGAIDGMSSAWASARPVASGFGGLSDRDIARLASAMGGRSVQHHSPTYIDTLVAADYDSYQRQSEETRQRESFRGRRSS